MARLSNTAKRSSLRAMLEAQHDHHARRQSRQQARQEQRDARRRARRERRRLQAEETRIASEKAEVAEMLAEAKERREAEVLNAEEDEFVEQWDGDNWCQRCVRALGRDPGHVCRDEGESKCEYCRTQGRGRVNGVDPCRAVG